MAKRIGKTSEYLIAGGDGFGAGVLRFAGPDIDRQAAGLDLLLDSIKERTAAVRANRGLNELGQRTEMSKIAADALKHVNGVRSGRATIVLKAAPLQAKYLSGSVRTWATWLKDKPPEVREASASRLAAIQVQVAAMTEKERNLFILTAAGAGDEESLVAIRSAPAVFAGRMPSPEQVTVACQRFLEVTQPEQFAAAQAADAAVEGFDRNVEIARRAVEKMTGLGAADPLGAKMETQLAEQQAE